MKELITGNKSFIIFIIAGLSYSFGKLLDISWLIDISTIVLLFSYTFSLRYHVKDKQGIVRDKNKLKYCVKLIKN